MKPKEKDLRIEEFNLLYPIILNLRNEKSKKIVPHGIKIALKNSVMELLSQNHELFIEEAIFNAKEKIGVRNVKFAKLEKGEIYFLVERAREIYNKRNI